MKTKQAVFKTAQKLPITSAYLQKKEQAEAIRLQADEIIGLKQSVSMLENRNKEWEEEVRRMRGAPKSLEIVWPVLPEDIIKADWTKPDPPFKPTKSSPPLTINWLIPPMGPVSGGHRDIFQLINYLEARGHKCNTYFYDPENTSSLNVIKDRLSNYPPIKSKLFYNQANIGDCDALFATSWHTAYPVFNYKGSAKKYYLVQDFEPFFDPVGTYSTLAENTYKFGLRGITLGSWLSNKLSKEYGMQCDSLEFGYDPKHYFLKNKNPRKKVFFYARPVTPRRGFELGILALQLFHEEHPEYEINFIGWDTSPYKIPFPYKDLGILPFDKLNMLYNDCAVGLVLSFTNMSLLPLELMAAGCRPVINDAEHTRAVAYSDQVTYAIPSPRALADSLYQAVAKTDEAEIEAMAKFAKEFTWNELNKLVESILLKEILA